MLSLGLTEHILHLKFLHGALIDPVNRIILILVVISQNLLIE